MTSAVSPGVGSAARVAWLDVAKAAAILLVVIYHTSLTFATATLPAVDGPFMTVWRAFSTALVPVRIPLFFIVSGVLAAGAVHRPWSVLVRTRFVSLLWPFLLWSALIAVPWAWRLTGVGSAEEFDTTFGAVFLGGAHYWYLPALVAFIALARLLRRLPVVALVVGAALAAVAPLIAQATDGWGAAGDTLFRWAYFAVWFLIGCFAPAMVRRVAAIPVAWAVGLVALFAILRWGQTLFSPPYGWALLLSLIGVTAAVILARWASRFAPVSRAGTFLAARTLPIYLVHALLLEVLTIGIVYARRRGFVLPESIALDLLFVPVVTAALVGASVAVYALARRVGAGWLFSPPRALVEGRGADGSRAHGRRG